MAAGRLSCLARNGRSPGEESRTAAVAAQAIEAQPSSGQISQREAMVVRRTASSGEVVANLRSCARGLAHRRRDGGHRVEKGRHRLSPTGRRQRISPPTCRLANGTPSQSGHGGLRPPAGSRQRSPHRSLPTCSMWGDKKASAPLVVQPPVSRRVSAPCAPPVRRRGQQRQSREGRAP